MPSSPTWNRRAAALAAALVCSLSALSDASAFTTTGVQSNGAECVAESSYDGYSTTRSSLGFRNNTTSIITVFCPIAPPSHDSYYPNLTTYSITDVELFYAGSAPQACAVVFRIKTGSLYWSSNMTSGPSASTGTTVLKLAGSFSVAHGNGNAVSQGITCSLPGSSRILGTTAKHSVTDVTGGI